jgi:hypothetical protein
MAGETTALSASENDPPFQGAEGLFLVPFTKAFSSTQNETNDVMEMGYLPADCTVYGFIYAPTDMDTNVSPGLVHKITAGSTDLVTGLTGAQTGTKSFQPCTPTALTAKTKVTVTSTTAAATGAAGTLYLAALCQR